MRIPAIILGLFPLSLMYLQRAVALGLRLLIIIPLEAAPVQKYQIMLICMFAKSEPALG